MSTPYLNLGIVSAYADAKRGGYTGTYDEFCALLAGIGGLQPKLTAGQNISITGNVIDTKAFPCNPNLFPNWYFGNPVNQRGQTNYTGDSSYSIDMLKLVHNMGLSVQSNGIVFSTVNNNDGAYASLVSGDSVLTADVFGGTMSVLTADGNLYSQEVKNIPENILNIAEGVDFYSDREKQYATLGVRLAPGATSPVILAVKLELGPEQTLAHQDADGKWVLSEIPDYGEQLLKCQRYLRPAGTQFITSRASGNIYGSVVMINSYPMRAVPSIVNANYVGSEVREVTGGVAGTITNVFTPNIYGSFTVQLSGTSMSNYVYIDPTGFNPLLSAEL